MDDDVRNFLIQNGPGQRNFLFDLYALNLQRGRDHGLPFYNNVRRAVGLRPYTSFNEFTEGDFQLSKKLESVYKSIDEMDLFVGIMA